MVAVFSTLLYTIGGIVWSPHAAAATSLLPPVLPNLQQWSAGAGTGYTWTGTGRIVVDTADASALTADAKTFAGDLGLDLNTPAPPVVSDILANALPGDVFLSLGSTDTQLGTEGYALTVAPVMQVKARAATGAFWGTRSILQLLRQTRSLPPGSARDWPQYPVRSVLTDNAAMPFPFGDVQNVFGRAPDGTLHHWWWQGSDPDYIHQETWAGPHLAADASPLGIDEQDNVLHVFARDGGGHLQHWRYDQNAGLSSEEDLTTATGLSIAGNPSGFEYVAQQHVYFRDATTGHMDHVWTKQGYPPASQDLSAITPGGVVDVVGDSFSVNVNTQEQHAFGLDPSGHVHNWFWIQKDDSLHQDTWQQ